MNSPTFQSIFDVHGYDPHLPYAMRPHLFYPDADPFNDYDYAISQLAFDGLAQWSSPPPPVKTQPTRVLSLSNLHPSTSAELLEGLFAEYIVIEMSHKRMRASEPYREFRLKFRQRRSAAVAKERFHMHVLNGRPLHIEFYDDGDDDGEQPMPGFVYDSPGPAAAVAAAASPAFSSD